MKAISLFSGIDGFAYAGSMLGIETVAQVEIEERLHYHLNHYWPNAKKFRDIKSVEPADLPNADIISGGDPCQPNSVAGKRKGQDDDRFLWPHFIRIVRAKRPTWIINENVIGSVSNLVLDSKITDLENEGYSCRAFNIPACAIGALHERKRIWLVAYSDRYADPGQWARPLKQEFVERPQKSLYQEIEQRSRDAREWNLGRGAIGRIFPIPINGIHPMADDVSAELFGIKSYGNSVSPWIPYVFLKFILQIENSI